VPDSTRKAGTLYVVATPIGNLSDMTFRAVETLSTVDLIAAEDTRHSRTLLSHYHISTPLLSYHEHNEQQRTVTLIEMLQSGRSVALISDAGTPLVSDPGYRLVKTAHARGIRVSPVPGSCAAIAVLSASGLPTDRFIFEGFPPPKASARRKSLRGLAAESRTQVFYESAHRIEATLSDMTEIFGSERRAVLAREVTKKFETIIHAGLSDILAVLREKPELKKGEFVIIVHGADPAAQGEDAVLPVLQPLLASLPLRQAVDLAARITGFARNRIYEIALKSKD
jgi:16S rRNA (cytidine1402-2'-O)-methyltransferase